MTEEHPAGSGVSPALRPELVDAHHHLLDLKVMEYPWIRRRSPVLEALLENYYDIARDYSVPDYLSDTSEERPVRSVACEFNAADPVAEAEWVQRQADDHGFPHAFIAGVDLTSPTLADVLARYREMPVVHAVRQPLYWADDPLKRLGPGPGLLTDPAWLRGFELVAQHGYTWDLLLYDEQLPAAHELLRSFPDTRFVLEAAGWPLDMSRDGFRRWEERMQAVSEHPNVTVKMQGLALLFGPSAERIRPWVHSIVRTFGSSRCMFASHFPVDRLLWSFDELVDTLSGILGELNADARAKVFSGCAAEQYGLAWNGAGGTSSPATG